jgi:hypothetical protein
MQTSSGDIPATRPPYDTAERRDGLLVISTALLLRAFVFAGAIADPVFGMHRFDEVQFDRVARALAHGNWSLVQEPFFLSPLWTAALTALYAGWSEKAIWVLVVQQALGVSVAWMTWRIARRYVERRTAVALSILWAACGPALFYETRLLSDSIVAWATVLAAWLMIRFRERPSLHASALMGLALGAAIAARPNAMLLVPLGAWVVWSAGSSVARLAWAVRARLAGAALAGGLLLLAPVFVFNAARGVQAISASSGAVNLYIGNHAGADGTWNAPPGWVLKADTSELLSESRRIAEQAGGQPATRSEVNRYWLHRTLDEVAADPGRLLGLVSRKLLLAVRNDEVADNRTYDYERQYMGVLSLPVWPGAGLFTALGIPGLVWLSWRRRDPVLGAFGLLLPLVTFAAFFVVGRYRLPWLPFLAVGVGFTAERVWAAIRTADWAPASRTAALSSALSAVAFWPAEPQTYRQDELLRANDLLNSGLPYESEPHYRALLASPALADSAHWNLARALLETGRPADAHAVLSRLRALRSGRSNAPGVEEVERVMVGIERDLDERRAKLGADRGPALSDRLTREGATAGGSGE